MFLNTLFVGTSPFKNLAHYYQLFVFRMPAAFICYFYLLFVPSEIFANGIYEISEPKFGCSFALVNNKDIITGCETMSGGTLSRGQLKKYVYAVVVIIGGQPALDFLEKNGHLPLNVTFWLDGRPIDVVDYGIKPRQWLDHGDAIRFELGENGFFDWRVPIFSQKIWGNKLELVFDDHNRQRLSPIGVNGNYKAIINFSD